MRIADIMESTTAYRLWQAPFAESKLRPLLRRGAFSTARRVLDVGCGPGTNARHFAHADYLGLDINPAYVRYARRRYGRQFQVADVRALQPEMLEPFDFILVNSLLHHVDLGGVHQVLSALERLLAPGGRIHILELVLPPTLGAAWVMARLDRGRHARPLAQWRSLFADHFEEVLFEPYLFGHGLWSMVYFQGGARP